MDLFKVKKMTVKRLDSDLANIKGVGPKTVLKFKEKGIHNKKQLDKWVERHDKEEFLKEFKGLYRYKKLAELLYEAEV